MKQIRLDPNKIGQHIDKIVSENENLEETVGKKAADFYLDMIAHNIAHAKYQQTMGQSIALPGGMPPKS